MIDADTDIDIDLADRRKIIELIPHVVASIKKTSGETGRHPVGVYFQDVPVNPLTEMCSIPAEEAADLGYFKVDFLTNTLYERVRDEEHLERLRKREPDWAMLNDKDIVGMLSHISRHYGTVQAIKPNSVEELAMVIALIRPGKQHLRFMNKDIIEAEIWKETADGYNFKKSHAIAYALSIVVQMNLLYEETAERIGIEI